MPRYQIPWTKYEVDGMYMIVEAMDPSCQDERGYPEMCVLFVDKQGKLLFEQDYVLHMFQTSCHSYLIHGPKLIPPEKIKEQVQILMRHEPIPMKGLRSL
jgi:hypothetical protein